jgi:hypothetical protein
MSNDFVQRYAEQRAIKTIRQFCLIVVLEGANGLGQARRYDTTCAWLLKLVHKVEDTKIVFLASKQRVDGNYSLLMLYPVDCA